METTSKDSLLVDLQPLHSVLEDINISWKQSPSEIYKNIRNYLKEESSKNPGSLKIIVLYLIIGLYFDENKTEDFLKYDFLIFSDEQKNMCLFRNKFAQLLVELFKDKKASKSTLYLCGKVSDIVTELLKNEYYICLTVFFPSPLDYLEYLKNFSLIIRSMQNSYSLSETFFAKNQIQPSCSIPFISFLGCDLLSSILKNIKSFYNSIQSHKKTIPELDDEISKVARKLSIDSRGTREDYVEQLYLCYALFYYLTLFDTVDEISYLSKTSDTSKEEIENIEEEINGKENAQITEQPKEVILQTINQIETIVTNNLTKEQSLNIFKQTKTHLLEIKKELELLNIDKIVNQIKIQKLSQENERLKGVEEKVEILQNKLNEQDTKISKLTKEHNELIKEHNELVKEHNELVKKNNELDKDHNELVKKYIELEDKYNKLEEEKKIAEKTYKDSLHKIVIYQQNNAELIYKNKQLNERNNELTLDLKLLSKRGYIKMIILLCKSMNLCKINNEKFSELCKKNNKTILYQIKRVFNTLAHNQKSLPGLNEEPKMTALFSELKNYFIKNDYEKYEALVNIEKEITLIKDADWLLKIDENNEHKKEIIAECAKEIKKDNFSKTTVNELILKYKNLEKTKK